MSGGAARVTLWAGVVAVAGALVWANWAELDEVTRAPGTVISSSRNQVIQIPEGGVLAELLVQEGGKVAKGELLARFDKTKAEAGYLEGAARAAGLRAVVARLTAEIQGVTPKFAPELDAYPDFRAAQLALYARRQAALNEEIGAFERSLRLTREELAIVERLFRTGDVSRAEVLRLERQVNDLEGQITNRRNRFLQDSQAELARAQEDLAAIDQVVAQRRDQLSQTEVRAPMDGIVRNIRLTTIGGVARAGEEIMQIVPGDEDLIIEAKVRPADIAFIRVGSTVAVKFDAYDYTIYGALPGTVTFISPDTLKDDVRDIETPFYRINVKTTAADQASRRGPIVVQVGMTGTVEIVTGRRSVLAYLTKPITKTLDESLRER